MKKLTKTIFLVVCMAVLAVASVCVFVGCDNTPSGTTKYKISSLFYDNKLGTVVVDPEKTEYDAGDQVTVRVTPNPQYVIEYFYVDGTDQYANMTEQSGVYSYVMTMDANKNVQVSFKQQSDSAFTIKTNALNKDMGVITIEPKKDFYYESERVTITLDNKKGYDIKQFQVNGEILTDELLLNDDKYTIVVGDAVSNSEKVIDVNCLLEAVNYGVIKEINYKNFKNIIKNDTVLLDYYTAWCTNCPLVAKGFEKLATNPIVATDKKIRLCRVNTDTRDSGNETTFKNNEVIMKPYGLSGWPNVGLFKGGELVASRSGGGSNTSAELVNQMTQILLDFITPYISDSFAD